MCSEESMDKPSGKCRFRTQSWYLVLITFLLWFTLFYLYSTSATFGKVGDSFLGSNQIDFVESVTDEVIDETGDSEDVNNGNSDTEREQKPINFSIHDQAGLNKPLKAEQRETQSSVTISSKDEDMDNKTVDVEENGSISQLQIEQNKEKEKPSRRKNKKTIVDLSSTKEEWKQNASLESPITQKDVALFDSSSCFGRYIYMHDLPRKFNQDLLDNCKSLSLWTDMCEYVSNLGLGSPLPRNQKLYSRTGWFATNQFLLEVIFHYRMKQYECLTKDPSLASAIYVPYYAGLDVGRYLWDPDGFMRDYDAVNLVKWLVNRPEWKKMWGRDHFLVAGRINWDFRRDPKNESDWGNELLNFPESKNMTMLVIESSPWNNNDFAIPYPTYFHPTKDGDVFQWQDRMKRLKRRYLFSFAGAPRPNIKDSIRNEIINQCLASRRKCKFLECDKTQKCYQPVNLMKLFQSSVFCLQPPGDSYTRRSIFDAILAGCIPVFFHPGSAYVQYIWHFPKDYTKYSVMIPANDVKSGKANIERILRKFPREKIFAMREQVIRLIPKVIYADPSSRLGTIQDAFDLTIKGVLDRVETVRNQMRDGKEVNFEFDEEESWKYFTFGKLGVHEWDPFFSSKLGKPCK